MSSVVVRAPRPEDAESAFAVIAARDLADLGFVDYTLEDVLFDWSRPDVDAWVAELDGRVAGTAVVGGLGAMVCVDPARCGRGVGSAIREVVEARMRARGQLLLRQAVSAANAPGRELLAAAGYRVGQVYLTLRADLGDPATRASGDGAGVVRLLARPAEEEAAHRLIQDAFAELEGSVEKAFADWRLERLAREDLVHPVLLVAEHEGRVAGVLTGREREGVGFVEELAVDPGARGRGYGRLLLLAAFERFREAGLAACELSVQAGNAGAQTLYESVGLREQRRAERWEKPA